MSKPNPGQAPPPKEEEKKEGEDGDEEEPARVFEDTEFYPEDHIELSIPESDLPRSLVSF